MDEQEFLGILMRDVRHLMKRYPDPDRHRVEIHVVPEGGIPWAEIVILENERKDEEE